jgi:hypothetical protein
MHSSSIESLGLQAPSSSSDAILNPAVNAFCSKNFDEMHRPHQKRPRLVFPEGL